ncbi:MAG: hypothetical protein AB7O57_22060 [Hyphomicrobiaceae bacterium]
MLRAVLAAATLTWAASAASAAPVTRTAAPADATHIVEVQHRGDRDRHRDHDRRRWTPGHRYDSPPPRWRRYGDRPRDWRRRGCVIVGPVWFCP